MCSSIPCEELQETPDLPPELLQSSFLQWTDLESVLVCVLISLETNEVFPNLTLSTC